MIFIQVYKCLIEVYYFMEMWHINEKWHSLIFKRAFRYLQQAADAGNSNAMAYLGKVRPYVAVFSYTGFTLTNEEKLNADRSLMFHRCILRGVQQLNRTTRQHSTGSKKQQML